MGMYIYVTELDRTFKRKVNDPLLNEEFQEALKCDPSLMIEEYIRVDRSWFKTKICIRYNLFHEIPALDGSAYQARYQISGSGDANTVKAYLHGIINGVNHYKNQQQ